MSHAPRVTTTRISSCLRQVPPPCQPSALGGNSSNDDGDDDDGDGDDDDCDGDDGDDDEEGEGQEEEEDENIQLPAAAQRFGWQLFE